MRDPMARCVPVGKLCRIQAGRRRFGPIWLAYGRFVRPHGLWVPGPKASLVNGRRHHSLVLLIRRGFKRALPDAQLSIHLDDVSMSFAAIVTASDSR